MRLCIHGAMGRMGLRLVALAAADPDLAVCAAVERPDHEALGRSVGPPAGVPGLDIALTADLGGTLRDVDAVLSFALPDASAACVETAAAAGVACLVGTTGFTAAHEVRLAAAAKQIPLLCAANFAVGVNVLFKIAAEVAERLGRDFDIEIMEMHHNRKVDAPSGTALRLAEGVARATRRPLDDAAVYGRHGQVGARPAAEIGVLSLRGGDVVGEHTILFAGAGERLEITHRAQNRDLFVHGALRGAKWLHGRPPGRYDMFDVLGFRVPGN